MKIQFLFNTSLRAFLANLLLLFFPLVCFSQSTPSTGKGKITGKIIDAKTGNAIIGANVAITGTTKGDATDVDGRYSISELGPGFYSITASYISYAKKTVTDIKIEAGEQISLVISLKPETIDLQEVTVTAGVISNSEAGLLGIQRKAVAFQDGLSSEYINKTGDGNVASAIKRVTGVTLMNGKDIYVRGLGNRYSNIQLNGSPVPSASPTKKEVPVDLINSGSIDNIVVQKTFTPDQSGEFSGGSVQITSKEFPSEKNMSFSYSTGYNNISTFENTLAYQGSRTDFLGFDDGKRSMPAVLKSNRITLENEKEVAGSLRNNWTLQKDTKAIPSQKFGLSYSNQFNESKLPVGIVSNFSYKYNRSFQPNREFRVIQSYNADVGQSILNSDYLRNEGVENAKLSGMFNLFLKPVSNTKIGLKNLYSNSLQNSTTVITGNFVNYPGNTRQTVQDFDRRSILSNSIVFETYLSDFNQSKLSINLNYSRALRNRPDRRTTQYNFTPQHSYHVYFDDGGNTHFFSNQIDNNYTTKADFTIQPAKALEIKAGLFGFFKDRDFSARRLEYQNFSGDYPGGLKSEPADIALAPSLVIDGLLDLVETTQARDSYTGEQTLFAAYVSTSWDILKNFTAEVGARIENSAQKVDIQNVRGEDITIADVDKTDILPAVNMTFNATERTNIRGAFSITLARPEFREISDFRFQDFVGSQIVYGNTDLDRTRIYNYDLRFERYPAAGELFAVSVFYKKFFEPIELFYRFTERTEVQYKNAKDADLYGLEIEGRKNVTDRLQVVANGSYIISETRSKREDQYRTVNVRRPMYGQSPYSLNIGTYYTIPILNMELSANYNTFGKRIVTVGMARQPDDEYEQPFHQVDIGLKYYTGRFTLKADLENLLNQDVVYRQGDIVTNRYKPGISFNLGISYNL